jgi:hypothetical protein
MSKLKFRLLSKLNSAPLISETEIGHDLESYYIFLFIYSLSSQTSASNDRLINK